MEEVKYIKSILELYDLVDKFESQREELNSIMDSGKYTKHHAKRVALCLKTMDAIKDTNEKYSKSQLTKKEYFAKSLSILREATKEEN